MASAALEVDSKCEKALYRHAVVLIHFCDLRGAKKDLEKLLRHYPKNIQAAQKLEEVTKALGSEKTVLRGVGVKLSSAIEELTPGGTLRKVCVLADGEAHPRNPIWTYPWGLDIWLGKSSEKPVLTVHVVIRSVGGEELYSSRSRTRLPETAAELNEVRATMQELAMLDDLAGNRLRSPEEVYGKEERQPLRWRYGDPIVYKGLELAARSMKLSEKAVFEIDQPLLEPSVRDFYAADGLTASHAGLPDLSHHIEERRKGLMAEELPEWELDLENKTQRTVRAELELLKLELFRDLSEQQNGEKLCRLVSAGRPDGRRCRPGLQAAGDFCIASALDGTALYRVEGVKWIIGEEGNQSIQSTKTYEKVWVPKCIGTVLKMAAECSQGEPLKEGIRAEARLQVGPSMWHLNPRLARQYDWKRATHVQPPVAVTLEIHSLRNVEGPVPRAVKKPDGFDGCWRPNEDGFLIVRGSTVHLNHVDSLALELIDSRTCMLHSVKGHLVDDGDRIAWEDGDNWHRELLDDNLDELLARPQPLDLQDSQEETAVDEALEAVLQ
eukprot:gnl/TRDRNA2_/TRDRNA2_62154_c0_seq1.p1 gnl/TRDRNA2_/TRDRNA2_62154_c0~~gnl/TRDRNA2_/TRDRNA2_62154_c0_seq1.p1  ORF type:complete len:553 (+),score=99.70 gnl/TRDRNA2_/TRDRNA2_62154_c0_seq1:3-1661(+)